MFFNEEFFLYLLLPPIIFEAGLSLSRHHFFANFATIMLFAVVGTCGRARARVRAARGDKVRVLVRVLVRIRVRLRVRFRVRQP